MNAYREMVKAGFFARSIFVALFFLAASAIDAQEGKLRLEILNGHSGGVLCVAVSSDGKYALTGSADKTALLWDVTTRKQLRRFVGHDDAVSAVRFSKDGSLVLTASHDGSAFLWETATGRRVRGFKENVGGVLVGHFGKILSAAISLDGRFVATAGEDKTARIWDAKTGHQLFELVHPGRVNSVAFSPDSGLLLTGGEDKIARLYELGSGSTQQSSSVEHPGIITGVGFPNDGKRFVTASNGRAILWDMATLQPLKNFAQDVGLFRSGMAISPNGRTLYLGSRLFDIESEKIIGGVGQTGSDAAMSDDKVLAPFTDQLGLSSIVPISDLLSTSRSSSDVFVYDLDSRKEIGALTGRSDRVNEIAVAPDLRSIFVAAPNNTSSFWDLEKGERKGVPQTDQRPLEIVSAAFFPDGKRLLTKEGYSLVVRDRFELRILAKDEGSFMGAIPWNKDVAISPDGQFVLAKQMNSDLVTLRSDTLATVNHFQRDWTTLLVASNADASPDIWKNLIWHFALSPDGQSIALALKQKAGIWSFNDKGRPPIVISTENVRSLAFSPDGKVLVTASGGEIDMRTVGIGSAARANAVRFWNVETGQEIDKFGGEFKLSANKFSGFKSIAYSPDGKFIAAGAFDGKVYLRNQETKEIRKFEGHTDEVNSVRFAKDANENLLVVSGSSDSTVRLWSVVTGEELCALVTFRDGSWAVVETKTGRFDTNNVEAIDGLQWVSAENPLQAIPADVVLRQYFEPDLLRRILKCKAIPTANGSDACGKEFKPLPPIGSINRIQPRVSDKRR